MLYSAPVAYDGVIYVTAWSQYTVTHLVESYQITIVKQIHLKFLIKS